QAVFYSVAANLAQPVFDGFRLEGQLELAKGRQIELFNNYRKSIVSAFGDVEQALIAIADGAERERLQRDVVMASRRAFEIAEPVPVLAIDARVADVPVYIDGVGTARALNTVTVRAQVEGKLMAVLFTEGQDVPKGFLLAKIDPTTYQAQYDQATAKKAQDEALLANAKLDLERYIRLAASNAVNKQQV